jgi:hypothetical protein
VKKRKNGVVTPEAFVRAWQQAASRPDAAAAVGMTLRQASDRVMRYRRMGIPLKRMPVGRPAGTMLDVAALTKLALSAAKVKP